MLESLGAAASLSSQQPALRAFRGSLPVLTRQKLLPCIFYACKPLYQLEAEQLGAGYRLLLYDKVSGRMWSRLLAFFGGKEASRARVPKSYVSLGYGNSFTFEMLG